MWDPRALSYHWPENGYDVAHQPSCSPPLAGNLADRIPDVYGRGTRSDHLQRRIGTLPQFEDRDWRSRHWLDSLCDGAHGLRMGRPVQRFGIEEEAQRVLVPANVRDVPTGPDRQRHYLQGWGQQRDVRG